MIFHAITNPVLVIWGRQDKVVPVAHAQATAQGLPDASVEMIHDYGHIPQLEQLRIFITLMLEFLGA